MVESVINAFSNRWKDHLSDPDYVRERCIAISDLFVVQLRRAGVRAELISGVVLQPARALGFDSDSDVVTQGHFAVLVNGQTVYDWTARQFDPASPVPLVQPLSEWRQTWRDLTCP